jgi:hypothetical protein
MVINGLRVLNATKSDKKATAGKPAAPVDAVRYGLMNVLSRTAALSQRFAAQRDFSHSM